MHSNLHEAQEALMSIGQQIATRGLPLEISPLVFTFTGSGNVSKGARDMFELLPHEYIDPTDLPNLKQDILSGKRSRSQLYGVIATAKDMVRIKSPTSSASAAPFDKAHYYAHPDQYEAKFHEAVLPYTSVLVNGMYWDYRYPRLVTKAQIKDLRVNKGNKTLLVVADISYVLR